MALPSAADDERAEGPPETAPERSAGDQAAPSRKSAKKRRSSRRQRHCCSRRLPRCSMSQKDPGLPGRGRGRLTPRLIAAGPWRPWMPPWPPVPRLANSLVCWTCELPLCSAGAGCSRVIEAVSIDAKESSPCRPPPKHKRMQEGPAHLK